MIKINVEIGLVSFHDYQNNKLLVFKKTCGACPCQYDIYDNWKFGKPNYYGRLRYGYFYVAKKPCGEPIYEFDFKDGLKGCFEDTEEEIKYLKNACKEIWHSQDI